MANKITRRRLVDSAIKSNNLAIQSGVIISELLKNRDEINALMDKMIEDMYDRGDTDVWPAKILAMREEHKKKEEEWNKE